MSRAALTAGVVILVLFGSAVMAVYGHSPDAGMAGIAWQAGRCFNLPAQAVFPEGCFQGLNALISGLSAPLLPLDRAFPVYDWPRDLAWDGNYLWYVESSTNAAYKLDPHTGRELASFRLLRNFPTGLTWDGENLWLANWDPYGSSHDMVWKMDTEGNPLQTFWVPNYNPTGLAWDDDTPGGPYLWMTRFAFWQAESIDQLDPRNGLRVVRTIPAPQSMWGPQAWGLAWDGSHLWVGVPSSSQYATDEIVRVDPASGWVVARYGVPPPSPPGPMTPTVYPGYANFPIGLTWEESEEGNFLWASDEGTDLIYRFIVSTGTPTPTPTPGGTTPTPTATEPPTPTGTPTPTATEDWSKPTFTSTSTPTATLTPSPTPVSPSHKNLFLPLVVAHGAGH